MPSTKPARSAARASNCTRISVRVRVASTSAASSASSDGISTSSSAMLWTRSDKAGKVKLEISTDGGVTFTPVNDFANTPTGPIDVFHAGEQPASIVAFRPAQGWASAHTKSPPSLMTMASPQSRAPWMVSMMAPSEFD